MGTIFLGRNLNCSSSFKDVAFNHLHSVVASKQRVRLSAKNLSLVSFSSTPVHTRVGSLYACAVEEAEHRGSKHVVASIAKTKNCKEIGRREWQGDEGNGWLVKLSQAVSCAVAAGCILLHTTSAVLAEVLTISFPVSKDGEITKVQRTLVEAWGIIRETYVDTSFNQQDWDMMLQESLGETLSFTKSEDVYKKIRSMLATLGDPFTRIITPQEYQTFRINNDGALEGVGLLISSDRNTGRLVVMSSIPGGPAARAGIHSGDEIVQIDDESLTSMNGEDAAKRLRGRPGTSVTIKLLRSVKKAGAVSKPQTTEVNFKLQRETVHISPVYTTVLEHTGNSGHLKKIGYIRLSAFPQNAAVEMEKAISVLEDEGVESYILDLRNNPGGLVKAGLDIAQMWLDGKKILVNTVDRAGDTQPITLVNGHAMTNDPLIILVNEGSASASEILAGALRDNGRATLVGEKTFGKGKIQSVSELRDGSALFVTVAKYLSPHLSQIDQIGITPDLKCRRDDIALRQATLDGTEDESVARTLQHDACVLTAERELDKQNRIS